MSSYIDFSMLDFLYFISNIWVLAAAGAVIMSFAKQSNRKENKHHFPPELKTFVFTSWPRYTLPRSLSSVTRLLALVTQFHYLPLFFLFKALCMQSSILITSGFLNVYWQFKYMKDSDILPATNASHSSVCCTNNVQLQVTVQYISVTFPNEI